MTRRATGSEAAQRLRSLADDPAEQAEYAVAVVRHETDSLALEAALRVLAERPMLEAREPLVRLYERLDANGVKRDQGCYLRVAILKALRPIVHDEDQALVERAALTVEHLPPGRQDVAHALRATALLTLDTLDSDLAAYHAVRLLFDSGTQGTPSAINSLSQQGRQGCNLVSLVSVAWAPTWRAA